MYRLFNKIKYLIIFSIVIFFLFFYFAVFMPLKSESEKTLLKNFNSNVSMMEINLENKIDQFIIGAESLSSRTMIKNELNSYIKGEIRFEELKIKFFTLKNKNYFKSTLLY